MTTLKYIILTIYSCEVKWPVTPCDWSLDNHNSYILEHSSEYHRGERCPVRRCVIFSYIVAASNHWKHLIVHTTTINVSRNISDTYRLVIIIIYFFFFEFSSRQSDEPRQTAVVCAPRESRRSTENEKKLLSYYITRLYYNIILLYAYFVILARVPTTWSRVMFFFLLTKRWPRTTPPPLFRYTIKQKYRKMSPKSPSVRYLDILISVRKHNIIDITLRRGHDDLSVRRLKRQKHARRRRRIVYARTCRHSNFIDKYFK